MADQPPRPSVDASYDKIEQSRVMIDALRNSVVTTHNQLAYARQRAAESWAILSGCPPRLVDDSEPPA